MKFASRTLLILLSAGMILSTGVGDFVNSDVIAKEKKSKGKKGGKGASLPRGFNQLGLSKDQISKIKGMIPDGLGDLIKERREAMKTAGDDPDKKKAAGKTFSKKMKPLMDAWLKDADSVLTKDQKKKFAALPKRGHGKGHKKKKK